MLKFTAILTLLWLPSLLMNWSSLDNFFAWRHQLTMYTGLLGLGFMCFAVLLAARFRWVEEKVRGLDKGYKLHKNLGIGATVSLIAHWLVIQSGKWLVGAGIVERPVRGPRPEGVEAINWHSIAEQVGEIAFYVFLVFSVISLVQAISYKKFKFTHKIGGLLVIAGIFHSLLLLDWNTGSIPMNIAIAVISFIGIWCSWLSLSGSIGRSNKTKGEVISVDSFSTQAGQSSAVRFAIKLTSEMSYRDGQFAYLNFHDGEAPHPFSILDYDDENQVIQFGVKNLGDYTHKLVNGLEVGQRVTVEGGYGYFQISEFSEQVWVGAGIGIVPFISRLYWLKRKADKQDLTFEKVHLFYCVTSKKEAFFHREIMNLLTHLDFIDLHLLEADKGQLLTSDQIVAAVQGKEFDVSFCGPQPFGNVLQTNLALAGVPKNRFHREIFKMR
ncbi:oxidoreductase [Vibrio albus]|uniref:Oxidoreductase n=1 Tax=Vibrio albus TaxID=2200953 RepID=A0A2U3B6J2_9VIBR|nr:ferric reductase-like transmembrane domain-containing protein [Vibrio albus]PWI32344.1 oxidoreductase [Vibrio albus]